jgi:hypothetical protein
MICTSFTQTEVAEAGPLRGFFRALTNTIPHPEYRSRQHRGGHKGHNQTPPSDDRATPDHAAGPPDGQNVHAVKATSVTQQRDSDLPYGTPVPGKQGLVTSPFSAEKGYVDVRGFPPGTPVKDPYTDKIFRTP